MDGASEILGSILLRRVGSAAAASEPQEKIE